MQRVEINLITGEEKIIKLTESEIAAAQEQAAIYEREQKEAEIRALEASLVPVKTREEIIAEIERLRGEL